MDKYYLADRDVFDDKYNSYLTTSRRADISSRRSGLQRRNSDILINKPKELPAKLERRPSLSRLDDVIKPEVHSGKPNTIFDKIGNSLPDLLSVFSRLFSRK